MKTTGSIILLKQRLSSSLYAGQDCVARDGTFKLLRNPGIDSKESILPAYVSCRSGTTTLFLLGS
jgi:hypothetical protein